MSPTDGPIDRNPGSRQWSPNGAMAGGMCYGRRPMTARSAFSQMPANFLSSKDFPGRFPDRFDLSALLRGRAYAAEGRARVKHIERAPGEIHVEAAVQGARKRPYEVDLWLEVDQAGAIVDVDNVCMCPMQENCKHVVAAMLSLGEITGIGAIAGAEPAPNDERNYPQPSLATLDWLSSLDQPATQKPPASRRRV